MKPAVALAAQASRGWWVLWRPFWPWWPLVLAARVQLAVILLAVIPLVIRVDKAAVPVFSLLSSGLVVYGVYAQLMRKHRLRRFTPLNSGRKDGGW